MNKPQMKTEGLPDYRSGNYYIYGLKDPDSGELRYVGATWKLKERIEKHNSKSRKRDDIRVSQWLASLESQGKAATVEILCTLTGPLAQRLIFRAERDVIAILSLRHPLLNVTSNIAMLRSERNKYRHNQITFKGKTQTMAEWGRELGLTGQRIRQRLMKYPVEVALTTPKGCKPENKTVKAQ